eukprot:scaffold472_cov264-Pinguiococcus_pyrenoidosus.AAC.5
MAVLPQALLMLLCDLVKGRHVAPLQELVLVHALQRELRDDAEAPQAGFREGEQLGLLRRGQRQVPLGRSDQLHGQDLLLHRGQASPGAVRSHLRPAGDLLLLDGAEVRQREAALVQLLEHVRHPDAGLHRDSLVLQIQTHDAVQVRHTQHAVLAHRQAIRGQSLAHRTELRVLLMRTLHQPFQLASILRSESSLGRHLMRAAPVGERLIC